MKKGVSKVIKQINNYHMKSDCHFRLPAATMPLLSQEATALKKQHFLSGLI